MPSRFTDTKRFQRARRISNTKVPVFDQLSSDPLIVYAEIQGSGSTPYKIMFDMKDREVFHDCPDIRRKKGGWCKHLVKILLQLDTVEVEQVYSYYKSKGEVTHTTSNLNNRVRDYRIKLMEKHGEVEIDPETSLVDLLKLSDELSDGNIPHQLSIRVRELIEDEIETISPLKQPIFLNQLLNSTRSQTLMKLDTDCDSYISDKIITSTSSFVSEFFTISTKFKLEIAFHLRKLIENCGVKLDTDIIKINKEKYREFELKTFVAILDLLISKNEEKREIITSLGLHYEDDELIEVHKHLAQTLRLKGTSHRSLKIWAEARLPYSEWKIQLNSSIDDILIYFLKSVGKHPKLNISTSNKLGIWSIPVAVLNSEPEIIFCIKRIIEDDRDYVSYKEFKRHSRFFNYLQGENIQTNWVERLREYTPDAGLPSDGIIIQWDVTGKHHHNEILHALTDDYRMIIDQNSPVANQIQPFDFTICKPAFTTVDRTLKIAYPEYIISYEQVITYLKNGIEIVSNVLPFDILSKYYSGKQIHGPMVERARVETNHKVFVTGSLQLLDSLEELANLGKQGISNSDYLKIHEFIQNDTGRLNKRSRPVIDQLITGEGKDLEQMMQLLNLDKPELQRKIIKHIIRAKSIIDFRKSLAKDVTRELFQNQLNNHTIEILEKTDFGIYSRIFSMLVNKTKNKISSLKTQLDKDKLTRSKLHKDPLGKVIAVEASIMQAGSLNDDEKAGAKIILERLSR